ncbi:hypothetical protein [Brucella vulpis]|uniref:hypothetical protein n=1 Tax=Brucella vulpis TaxID=981386 RepID=UPI004033000C
MVACIDRKDADSHKNDRGDHQDCKKGGILGGHIPKLFRRLPDKFDGTNSLAGLANGPTRLIAARTTAISCTRKSYPQLNGTGAVDSFIWKKRIGGPLWQSSNAMIETANHVHLDNGHFRFRTMQMRFSMHVW